MDLAFCWGKDGEGVESEWDRRRAHWISKSDVVNSPW